MRPRRRSSNAALDARRAEALALRTAGLSYRSIAERTSTSHEQARQDVAYAINQVHASWTLESGRFRTLAMCRLDALLQVWWPLSIADPPDPTAANIVLSVIELQATITGLMPDTPLEPNDAE